MKKEKTVKKLLIINKRLENYATATVEALQKKHSFHGLDYERVKLSREQYGTNKMSPGKKTSVIYKLFSSFINPFSLVLIVLGLFSIIIDLVLAGKTEKDPTSTIIIFSMVFISGVLKFFQEYKSNKAAAKLSLMVETTTLVERDGVKNEIPVAQVVCYDIIHLKAGDIVPADCRLLSTKDLFLSQSMLTGESEQVEKTINLIKKQYDLITDMENLVFMGTTVISGYGRALVISVGDETYFGQLATKLTKKRGKTSFELGLGEVSKFLVRVMIVVVPFIFIINGVIKNDWLEAFLFAISIAIGLTPEMLPTIVATALAKGAVSLSKKKVIVKKINSIQNFGGMDLLCTDKTGTLTQDKVVVEKHLDIFGKNSIRVLRHAYLNSYFQTGLKNLLDISIITKVDELKASHNELMVLANKYQKIDEIPFDFKRKRMSVVISDINQKRQMITKGAFEEIISICSYVEGQHEVVEINEEILKKITTLVDKYNSSGYRVIAVAQKTNPSPVGEFGVNDEKEMVLIGFLTFFDPPKETAKEAIKTIKEYGVDVRVLTGDNEKTTISICKMVGINVSKVLLGKDILLMDDLTLKEEAKNTQVFAKLSPNDKARIIRTLKSLGHTVGFMGDGINDAPALLEADVSISVDSAVDIAKESADIILLEKDLNVLKDGIIEGRVTFSNMMKYIKITVSSNFGNIFSVIVASIFLPFLPMLPLQLLILNLIYDITCIALPWDNVSEEYLKKPRKLEYKAIFKFMLTFGPISSIFDISTFILMYFYLCPLVVGGNFKNLGPEEQAIFVALFRAGWFIESMWTQTLVVHFLRVNNPFVNKPSFPVLFMSIIGLAIVTLIPFLPIGTYFSFAPPPMIYFLGLIITVVLYIGLTTLIKKIYLRKNNELI